MRAIDPRAKVARTLFNNNNSSSSSKMRTTCNDLPQQPPFTRVEPSMSIAPAQGPGALADSPATPRSWVPIGSPSGTTDSSICSDEEDELDGNGFFRSTGCDRESRSSTTSSCSSDDERMMAVDGEYQNGIATKIERIESCLKNVLQANFRSTFLRVHPHSPTEQNCLPSQKPPIDNLPPRPKHIPSSLRKKLKNWVSQLASQLEHDPNLDALLATVLSSSSSPPSSPKGFPSVPTDIRKAEEAVVLDLASLPMIHGFDYYRARLDDEYEIQEERIGSDPKKSEEDKKGGKQSEGKKKAGEGEAGTDGDGDGGDQRPYLIKKLSKLPTSVVVKMNEGKLRIAFSLISHLFKFWIKLGLEPVPGSRHLVLSVLFPSPPSAFQKATQTQDSMMVDSPTQDPRENSKTHLPSVHHWLVELAHMYKVNS
jgi:hypothetical protein